MIYQLPELTKYEKIIHGFSTKEAGNMSFRWGKEKDVIANRKKFLEQIGLNPKDGVCTELTHKDTILNIGKSEAGNGILQPPTLQADGLLTNQPETFLMHVVADCASLLFYDPDNRAIGLAHAGWQGTEQHITKKMVEAMEKNFASNPKNLLIGIGPTIHQCCYAFKNIDRFTSHQWQPFLKKSKDEITHINLIGLNIYQLTLLGVPNENIFVSHYCTSHSGKFFSHYRDQKEKLPEGRFAAVIGLK